MSQPSHFPDRYFSVSEIGERAGESLVGAFPDPFWVKGEITNLSNQKNLAASSRYIFCALKDQNSQITLYIPASSPAFPLIPTLKEGTEVYVYGRMNYYIKQNSINIRVFDLLVSGEGELRRQFAMMKKRLEEEGLFDPMHKKPIPRFPRCIGVVTSATGAAIQDILSRTRQPYGAVDVILFPVAVQGKSAAQEIATAIDVANRYFRQTIDLLIVGRGGGSVEDLWAFNEEVVARAIFNSEIPVISAVGHEVDWTIADYVADFRAPTPTAAGEHVMKDIITTSRTLSLYAEKLLSSLQSRLSPLAHALAYANPGRLFHSLENRLASARREVTSLVLRLSSPLERRLETTFLHLDSLHQKILTIYHKNIQAIKHRLSLLGEKLKTIDPTRVLERGYSITYLSTPQGKKILRSSEEVFPGQSLVTQLFEGEIVSVVDTTTSQKTGNSHPHETA